MGATPRGRDACRRRPDLVLRWPDRQLQDPAVLEVRRRVPDDRDRKGPEVQDARGSSRGAGAAAGSGRPHGVAPTHSGGPGVGGESSAMTASPGGAASTLGIALTTIAAVAV